MFIFTNSRMVKCHGQHGELTHCHGHVPTAQTAGVAICPHAGCTYYVYCCYFHISMMKLFHSMLFCRFNALATPLNRMWFIILMYLQHIRARTNLVSVSGMCQVADCSSCCCCCSEQSPAGTVVRGAPGGERGCSVAGRCPRMAACPRHSTVAPSKGNQYKHD